MTHICECQCCGHRWESDERPKECPGCGNDSRADILVDEPEENRRARHRHEAAEMRAETRWQEGKL